MAFKVVGVSLQGAAEFKAKLAQMTEEARGEVVEKAAMDGAAPILWEAVRRAPVLKEPDPRRIAGNLATKIDRMLLKKEPGKVTVGVGIGKRAMRDKVWGVFYVLWVEFGTRFMDALPFLRPAYDAKKDEAAATTIGTFQTWLGKFAS